MQNPSAVMVQYAFLFDLPMGLAQQDCAIANYNTAASPSQLHPFSKSGESVK